MKEIVITSIRSADEVNGVTPDLWEVKFLVKQKTPIKYSLQGTVEWKGAPIINDIQVFIERLTEEVKTKRVRTK